MGPLPHQNLKTAALAAALLALCALAPPAGRVEVRGVSTVLPFPYSLRSTLMLKQAGADPLVREIDITDLDPSRGVLRAYDTDMTKKLHLIVISDDFRTFMHVHPVLGADGHFRLDLRFPRAARYHLYADAVPHAIGRTVFRYDVNIAGTAARPSAERPLREVRVGPYRVALDPDSIFAGSLSMLTVTIHKGDAPANDLHPYLGALAHAVLVDESDLSYVHAHAMTLQMMARLSTLDDCDQHTLMTRMNFMTMPPDAHVPFVMMLHVTPPRRGRYKLWVQFRGGKQIYAAPFIIDAV